MCILAWHWQAATQSLLLIGNRDEYYARPSTPLAQWSDMPIVGGRDLQAGGTWLGVYHPSISPSQDQPKIPRIPKVRLAALTNVRNPKVLRSDAPSRGGLVRDFLLSDQTAAEYAQTLLERSGLYNPFNLLLFDGLSLLGFESQNGAQEASIIAQGDGIGAVSNAGFNTPWPKLVRLRQGLERCLQQQASDDADLLALLTDTNQADDTQLPNTGVSLEAERSLSSIFIRSPSYGTRACSILRIGPMIQGSTAAVSFLEQGFDSHGMLGVNKLTYSR